MRVIAGKPEGTLCGNNKITCMFRWHIEFQVANLAAPVPSHRLSTLWKGRAPPDYQVAMPGTSGPVTSDEQD